MNIKKSNDHPIFVMGSPYSQKDSLYIEMGHKVSAGMNASLLGNEYWQAYILYNFTLQPDETHLEITRKKHWLM